MCLALRSFPRTPRQRTRVVSAENAAFYIPLSRSNHYICSVATLDDGAETQGIEQVSPARRASSFFRFNPAGCGRTVLYGRGRHAADAALGESAFYCGANRAASEFVVRW